MKVVLRSDSVEIDGYVNAVGRESRVLRDADGYFTETIGWSFGFYPVKQRFEDKDGMRHRIVEDMNLSEVSIIDMSKLPAYAATSVYTRDAGDDARIEIRTMELQDVETDEERAADPPIDYSYYRNAIRELGAE